MTQHALKLWLFVILTLTNATAANSTAFAQDKPNIVLVFMDNFGYGELGCYGGGITRGAPTPRIDKLATEGIRLRTLTLKPSARPAEQRY